MEYIFKDNNTVLYQPDFNLAQTLDCGQAFRWADCGDGFCGTFVNRPLRISCESDGVFILHDTTEEDFLTVWADYFDLHTDYGCLKKSYSQDDTLTKACAYAPGIRLLRQDSWEALCSFIISQNNNIPRIKGIIDRLCSHFDGFPTAEMLASYEPDDLAFLRSGFRAKYIVDAARSVAEGRVDLSAVRGMPIEEARKTLMTIKGVGPKVAECALLYGMYRTEAFPIDVWIKRVMAQYYPDGIPEYIKDTAGIAQQYLFHYIRNLDRRNEK